MRAPTVTVRRYEGALKSCHDRLVKLGARTRGISLEFVAENALL